jgi:hypothetical protein
MTTTISPSGGKFTKFLIRSPRIICTPAPDTRLVTSTTLPSVGETTETPSAANSQLAATTSALRITNNQNGCGSLLPHRSTRSSTRSTGDVVDRRGLVA